jgi:nucleotide-binding universal stress UspA family protein
MNSSFTEKAIVAPTDFSEESDRSVNKALELAASADKLHVVHVAPSLLYLNGAEIYPLPSERERRETILASMRRHFAGSRFENVIFDVCFGDPGRRIAERAEELDAGLIVLPSHGRTGVAHLLIGSVAERVVRLARCPVLVMRSGRWRP